MVAGWWAVPICWVNGRATDAEAVPVSAFARGLTVGLGVFETMVSADGRVFARGRHWARLRGGCAAFGLRAPTEGEFAAALRGVMEVNSLRTARLRYSVFAGVAGGEDMHVATAVARPVWPATARVVTVPWRRNEHSPLAGHKATAWAENALALAEAHRRGADEALFLNTAGKVCEGATSNVFMVNEKGVLFTPSLDSGCLPGVTREVVLELCAAAGLVVAERAVTEDDLRGAREVFLTSSTRGVHPVSSVDDRPLSAPGPVTVQVLGCWQKGHSSMFSN